jgi:hypothetical protein
MDFKKGDIVYTEEYSIGLFEVYAVEGDRIKTSPHGWANRSGGIRFAKEEDFKYEDGDLYEKFLIQNKNNINNYEIY